MANIWPVYEGREPTRGGPWASLPVSEAITLFELRPEDFISEPRGAPPFGPRFGDASRDLAYAGFKHIVVEIEPAEGRKVWKAGFYKSPVGPREAFRRLLQQALVSGLGRDNVVRLEFEPAADSLGHEAIEITVVIPPDAIRKLKGRRVVDGLVKLRERLHEMRDERTPIVRYATEADLEQVGRP